MGGPVQAWIAATPLVARHQAAQRQNSAPGAQSLGQGKPVGIRGQLRQQQPLRLSLSSYERHNRPVGRLQPLQAFAAPPGALLSRDSTDFIPAGSQSSGCCTVAAAGRWLFAVPWSVLLCLPVHPACPGHLCQRMGTSYISPELVAGRFPTDTSLLTPSSFSQTAASAFSYLPDIGEDLGAASLSGPLRPLPRSVEGPADDPRVHNPLLRQEMLGTGWMGVVIEYEGIVRPCVPLFALTAACN